MFFFKDRPSEERTVHKKKGLLLEFVIFPLSSTFQLVSIVLHNPSDFSTKRFIHNFLYLTVTTATQMTFSTDFGESAPHLLLQVLLSLITMATPSPWTSVNLRSWYGKHLPWSEVSAQLDLLNGAKLPRKTVKECDSCLVSQWHPVESTVAFSVRNWKSMSSSDLRKNPHSELKGRTFQAVKVCWVNWNSISIPPPPRV